MKILSLENYDGYGFEKLCADILEKAGYGKAVLTPKSGDGGKDIIITTSNGETIYVECKHHPGNTIGRPVVQKLHSAMITGGAQYGMIITSGRFSPDAEDYVIQNNIPIQLIDSQILSSIAIKCGIQIYRSQAPIIVSGYPIPEKSKTENCVKNYIKNTYDSKPYPAEKLLTFRKGYVKVQPFYECNYDLDYDLRTSTRVLKHHSISMGSVLIDGKTGELCSKILRSIYENTPKIEYNKLDSDKWRGEVDNFQINETTFRRNILDYIKNKHFVTVDYVGNNNVHYSKSGQPSNNDIEIYNVEQLYIPHIQTTLTIKDKEYLLSNCLFNGTEIYVPNVLNSCSICGKKITHGVICNDCGSLVHTQRKLDSHSFICDICGKTICRKCTYLVGNKHVCCDCAKNSGKEYSQIPQNTHQKLILISILTGICIIPATILTVIWSIIIGIIPVIVLLIFVIILYISSYYENVDTDEYRVISFK